MRLTSINNADQGKYGKRILKKFDLLEKKIDFLLNELEKNKIKNDKMTIEGENLRKENSNLRESKLFGLKLVKELLNKFDEFGI